MAAKIEIILQGTNQASPAIEETTESLHGLSNAAERSGGALGKMGGILQTALGFVAGGIISAGINKITESVGGLINGMIGGNAEFERYETQFKTLLGSADAAKERLAALTEFAAKTPFELPEVVKADKILQSFGLESDAAAKKFGFNAQQIRQIAGDTAAGTGASFEEMSMLLGRFASGATGEALMRMAELGIGTREQLSQMGIAFSKSGELLSPMPQAMNAVLTLMKQKFGGLMEAQSSTFEGMVSNLQDWIGQTERAIGKPIFDVLKGSLGSLLQFLSSDAVKSGIDSFANGIAGGLQSAINAVSAAGTAILSAFQSVRDGLAAGPGVATINLLMLLGIPADAAAVVGSKVAEIAGAISNAKGQIQAAIQSIQSAFASGGTGGGVTAILQAIGIDAGVAEQVGSQVQGAIDGIKARLQAAFAGFWSGFATGGPGGGVAAFLKALGLDEGIADAVGGAVQGVVGNITMRVQAALQSFRDLASGNIGATYADWLKVFGVPEGIATEVGGKIQSVVNEIKSRVQAAIQGFRDGLAAGPGVATINFLTALGVPEDAASQIGVKVAQIPTAINDAKTRILGAIQGFRDGFAAGPGVATINILTALGVPEDTAVQIGAKVAQIPTAINDAKTRIQQAIQAFRDGLTVGVGVATINVLMTLGIPEDTAAQIAARVAGVVTAFADAKTRLQAAIQSFRDGFATGGVGGGASAFLAALGLDPSIVTTVQQVTGQIAAAISGAIASIRAAIQGFQSGGIGGLVQALGIDPAPIQQAIGVVLGLFDRLKAGIAGFFAEIAPAAEPLKQLLGEMAPLVEPALSALQKLAAFVGGALALAFAGLVGFVGGALPGLGQMVRGAVEVAVGAFETLVGEIRLVGTVVAAVLGGDWSGAMEGAKAAVDLMVKGVGNILTGLKDIFTGAVRAALDGLVSMITGGQKDAETATQDVVNAVGRTLDGIAKAAAESGRRLVEAFAAGIRAAVGTATSAISSVVSAVDQYLPHSDAQTGPLSGLTASGAALFATWAAGAQTGVSGAISVVQSGLNAIATAIRGGDAAQAMNELASLFRAIIKGFAANSEGIGGNAFNHIKRLIDSITSISGSVGDFIKAMEQLNQFAQSAVGQMAFTEAGKAMLVWVFDQIAQIGKEIAVAARHSAEGFINNETNGALGGLHKVLTGARDVIADVVGVATDLLALGGGPIEQLISSQAEQNWLVALLTGVTVFAVQLAAAATEAAGTVPQANASLQTLTQTLEPTITLVTATGSIIAGLLSMATGPVSAVLGNGPAQAWIIALLTGVTVFAVQLAAAANAAAGQAPVANASLANLNGTLQTTSGVVTATTGLITALFGIGGGAIEAALNSPAASQWLLNLLGAVITWAVAAAAVANAAAAAVPAVSAGLTNLSNTLQPVSSAATATIAVINAVLGVGGGAIETALNDPAASQWLINVLAALVAWAATAAAAANAAAGSVAPVSASLQNLATGLGTLRSVTDGTVGLIGAIGDAIAAGVPHLFDTFTTMVAYVSALYNLIRIALDLSQAADLAISSVAAPSASLTNLANRLGPIQTAVQGTIGVIADLGAAIKSGLPHLFDSFYNMVAYVSALYNLLQILEDLGQAADLAAAGVSKPEAGLANLAARVQPIQTLVSGTVKVLQDLQAYVKAPIPLTQEMKAEGGNLADALKALWAVIKEKFAEAAPTTDDTQAAQAWTATAGPITALTGVMDFLKRLKDYTSGPIELSQDMRSRLGDLATALKTMWGDLKAALGDAAPSDDDLAVGEQWSKAAGPISALTGIMDFLKKLHDYASGPIQLSQEMRTEFGNLATTLKQLWTDLRAGLGAVTPPTEEELGNAQDWVKAAGPVTALAGLMDFLHKLYDYVPESVGLTLQMEATFQYLAIVLKTLWVDLKAGLGSATPPTEAELGNVEAWTKTAGPIIALAGLMDFLHKLYDYVPESVGLTLQMEATFQYLAIALKQLWVDLKAGLGAASPPTESELGNAQDWVKAAGPVTALAGIMDFLRKLYDYAQDPIALSQEMRTQAGNLAAALKTLWGDLSAALADAAPTDAIIANSEQWGRANSGLTSLSGIMDYLKRLRDWAKDPIALSQEMRTELGNLVTALKTLWGDLTTALSSAAPSDDDVARMEGWNKAAQALSPLSQLMDTLKKLDEWTRAPVTYSAQIGAQVGNLMAALKDMARQFVQAAQNANIDQDMQDAATALADVGGKGLDMIGKTLGALKDLFEFNIQSEPGWVQQPGGNNVWSPGGTQTGVPGAEAVRGKVDQLMAGLKSVLDGVKAGLASLPTDIDTSALAKVQGVVESVSAITSSIHDLMTNMPQQQNTPFGQTVAAYFNLLVEAVRQLSAGLATVDAGAAAGVVAMLQDLAEAMTALASVGAAHVSLSFSIPDLAAEIEAIPVPIIHIPIVWDVPPMPSGSPAASGQGSGQAVANYQTTYNVTNNNTSLVQSVPAGVAALTAQSALFGGSPV